MNWAKLGTSEDGLCVGLTGGIGSGKSTVAALFKSLGAVIVDTDSIAHHLTQAEGAAMPFILSAFGADYLTPRGAMDRAKMRRLILADKDAKRSLEKILHPMILKESQRQANQTVPYVIIMAPLLLEVPGFIRLVQRVLLVNCSEQHQISRVTERGGLGEIEVRGMIALQRSQAECLALADDIIQNDGARDELINQVEKLHLYYLSISNNPLTAS
ncbi:MAG: dephospho-CoA kinase [Gallionella sp.]